MLTTKHPGFTALAALLAALVVPLIAPSPARASEELTAVVANVFEAPEAVLADDGRQHLAYELQLLNRAPYDVTVRRVETLARGRVIGSIGGDRLAGMMQPYGAPKPGSTLSAGRGSYVLMDVSLPGETKLPKRIVHRISITESEPSPANAKRYLAAPTRVIGRPAVVLAPPLRGPGWIVGNGCCDSMTAHRAAVLPVNGATHVAERFAIDFVQLTAANRLVDGPADMLASFPYFGATVYSASAGRVVGIQDGIAETPAGAFPKNIGAAEAGGNHIVVDIGKGRFAFYAHLQPGSPMVKVGQRVRPGQPLGLLGNSGNSDAPHLHFHVMDGPSPLVSDGVPYRFTRFSVQGTVTNLDAMTGGAVAKVDPRPRGGRARMLPLNNQVIDF
jgi:hypothetical protein